MRLSIIVFVYGFLFLHPASASAAPPTQPNIVVIVADDLGFDRAYGTGGGGNYFAPTPLYLDRQNLKPGDDYYITDAFTDYAVQFLTEHGKERRNQPFFLHLCYTAPHFPLQAKPADIAK